MYLYLFIIGFFIYNFGNIINLLADIIQINRKPSLVLTVRRLQPLFNKRKVKNLGIYEQYVFNREFEKYIKYGGSIAYLNCGFGSECNFYFY